MIAHAELRFRVVRVALLLAAVAVPTSVFAQGGVVVDAEGVMRVRRVEDPNGQLHRQRVEAARASLEQKLATKSRSRKVSLTRLEAALMDALENNRQPTDAMRHLAGLTGIQYVFFYPETKDIVLVGPAEGWVEDASGRIVGIDSGRPTILLEDLIVALRSYARDGEKGTTISVSIDPTPEGLKRMQEFIAQVGIRATPRDTSAIVEGLRTSFGLQQVSIRGISPKTHFAQVLVEADYRMKLIGIGLEDSGVGITSYVARANPSALAANALKRWYFMPNYECVRLSDDGLAAELVGDGVKLIGADELVAADGSRRAAAHADPASKAFTQSFTQRYGKLASRVPVYAQMRNCIDLSVAAAQIKAAGWARQAGWTMPVFSSEERYPVEVHNSPVQVEPAVNSIVKGNRLMTPIGGGVRIQAQLALKTENVLADPKGQVQKAHADVAPPKPQPGQWWWD